MSRGRNRRHGQGFDAAVPQDFERERGALAFGCGIEQFHTRGDVPAVDLLDLITHHQSGLGGRGVRRDGFQHRRDVLE